MNDSLKRYLETVRDLPLMPDVASQVMAATEKPDLPMSELRDIIQRDPAIVARMLKVANSALYGFSRQIGTLDHAIALMGMQMVKSLVLALSMKDVFKRFGLIEKLLLEHSSLAGPVTAAVGERLGLEIRSEELFVAGLLHDVGKIALVNNNRREYEEVLLRVHSEGMSFCLAEREAFGFDHAELGAEVAKKWRLAGSLETAIRQHHNPGSWSDLTPGERALTAAVALATACLSKLGVGRQRPVEELRLAELDGAQALGITEADEPGLLAAVGETLKQAEGLFS